MANDRNKIYLILAFILWITAYVSSFAIQGGTPLGPLLYIIGSVFFLLTQRPPQAEISPVQATAEAEEDTISVEDEDLDD